MPLAVGVFSSNSAYNLQQIFIFSFSTTYFEYNLTPFFSSLFFLNIAKSLQALCILPTQPITPYLGIQTCDLSDLTHSP